MRSHWLAALALSAGLGGACFGDITGKVTLTGKIPDMPEIKNVSQVPGCSHKDPIFEETVVAGEKGELANVVVSIKPPEGKALSGGQPAPAVLDQKGCVYLPHVVAVEKGQTITVKNSDSFLHNVHTLPLDNDAINKGMPAVGTTTMGPLKVSETFKVKCDVHPWMTAWIRVVDSPFFAVTKEDGTYSIDTTGLADGEYELVFWQEKYQEKSQKITVKGGKATANQVFDSGSKAQAPAAPGKDIKLATLLQTAATEKCDDGSCCDTPTKASAIIAATSK